MSGICDCLRCTNVAVGGGSRCSSCWWTQLDSCPCSCAGCWSPDSIRVRCALPGCVDFGYRDPLSYQQERCCELAHERMLVRLEHCPSIMPGGRLFAVSVYGPEHELPAPPVELLVSARMSVEALVNYVFMVFFGHNPNEEDLFGSLADIPRRWQVHSFTTLLLSFLLSSLFSFVVACGVVYAFSSLYLFSSFPQGASDAWGCSCL